MEQHQDQPQTSLDDSLDWSSAQEDGEILDLKGRLNGLSLVLMRFEIYRLASVSRDLHQFSRAESKSLVLSRYPFA